MMKVTDNIVVGHTGDLRPSQGPVSFIFAKLFGNLRDESTVNVIDCGSIWLSGPMPSDH